MSTSVLKTCTLELNSFKSCNWRIKFLLFSDNLALMDEEIAGDSVNEMC
jgi:hypothetical protein